jgi:hypothetical protein
MTRRTIVQLIQQANASLPDNQSAEIGPADVRNMVVDFLDTVTPMYGGLTATSKVINLTTTPQIVTFDSIVASFPPEWVANIAGTLQRSLGSLPGMTSRFTVGSFVEGPQGSEVRLQLYRNGAALPWIVEETMEGPTKSVGINLVALDAVYTQDATYSLMASTPTGTASVTFREMLFIGENVPVRDVPPVGMRYS